MDSVSVGSPDSEVGSASPNLHRRHSANDSITEQGAVRKPRGRTGCLNCRRRRKKCDEKKPTCSKCLGHGERCHWDNGFTFRLSGLDAAHPSMQSSVRRTIHKNRTLKIIDVNFSDGAKPSMNISSPLEPVGRDTRTEVSASDKKASRSDNAAGTVMEPRAQKTRIRQSQRTSIVEELLAPSNDLDISLNNSADGEAVPRLSDTAPGANIDWQMSEQYPLEGNIFEYTTPHNTMDSNVISANYEADDPLVTHKESSATKNPNAVRLWGQEKSQEDELRDGFSTTGLEALDYLTWHTAPTVEYSSVSQEEPNNEWSLLDYRHLFPSPISLDQALTEPSEFDSGYYPNAAYKELHTQLHTHMVATAMHTGQTRQTTPEPILRDLLPREADLDSIGRISRQLRQSTEEQERSLTPVAQVLEEADEGPTDAGISSTREVELMQNYLEEVARWLDMFDNQRHFQLKIPLLAKSASHLYYSILALSARQMERLDPDKPYTESLALYQRAIKLIVPKLHLLETEVIASCVLLCVLEMMTSSPRAWSRHLDGCAMLLQAAGINGVAGGVNQALFWCFARMDVWGGFLGHTITKIPTNYWFTMGESMSTVITRFRAGAGDSDNHANYAVFLCASVVNVISDRHGPTSRIDATSDGSKVSYPTRWKAIFDLLEDWHNGRTEEMQPLLTRPASDEAPKQPFPIILYPSPAAVSGNQLYHAAAILLLQERPREVKLDKSKKSILWHARQICGISVSNIQHGPWVNALQPLWIAGKLMSHRSEHEVILSLLSRIEKETGWATAWRGKDLMDHWGEL